MKKESWENFRQYLAEKCREKGVPSSATFELTARCNLKCRMCYVREDNPEVTMREKSAEQWLDLAKQAQRLGVLSLLFTGGEVFLRPDFQEIYEGVCSLGIIPIINTNATLIGDEEVAWLKRKPPRRVSVTLYGGSAETYGKLCKNKEGFEQARRGVDRLLASGIAVGLKVTVVPENVKDYQAIRQFADERDLSLAVDTYITPKRPEVGKQNCIIRLTPGEVAQFHHQLYSDMRKQLDGKSKASREGEQKGKTSSTFDNPFACSVGRDCPWVSWDGRMLSCVLMSNPATTPFIDGFQSAWEQLNLMVKEIPACGDCVKCKLQTYCYSCPARLKLETGSFEKKSEYLCDLAKEAEIVYSNRILRRCTV